MRDCSVSFKGMCTDFSNTIGDFKLCNCIIHLIDCYFFL